METHDVTKIIEVALLAGFLITMLLFIAGSEHYRQSLKEHSGRVSRDIKGQTGLISGLCTSLYIMFQSKK